MIREYLPPNKEGESDEDTVRIFLAGTIDMGKSHDWQKDFTQKLREMKILADVMVFNPRRKDWDSSWEQKITNDNFRGQVEWELENLEKSDVIVFNFEPGSVSIITMLELGKFSSYKNKIILVHCPDGYMRKGNVEIFCKRYNIPMYENWEDLYDGVRALFNLS